MQAAEPPLSTSPLGKGGPPPRRVEGAPSQSLEPEPTSLSFSSQRAPPLSPLGPPPRSRRDQPPCLSDLSPRGPSLQRDASILADEKVATTYRPHHSTARVARLAGSRAPPPSNRTVHCRHSLLVRGPAAPLSLALAAASVAGVYLRGGGTRSYRRLRESGNDAPGLGPWSAIPRGVGGRMCSHQLSWLPVAGRPVCQKNRLSPHQPPHIELPTCTSAACTLKPPRALPEVCS